MKKLALHWKIIIGLIAGIIWAFLSIKFGWNSFTSDWIAPWGDIFIKLLKLIAIPLVMFSIITGIASIADLSKLGRISTKTLTLYLITTFTAVTIGLVAVNFFNPGKHIPHEQKIKNRILFEKWQALNPEVEPVDDKHILSDPDFAEYIAMEDLEYVEDKSTIETIENVTSTKKSPLSFVVDMVPDNIVNSLSSNSLLLQVIVFAFLFGICLKKIPEEYSKTLTHFFEGLNHVYLKFIGIAMEGAPFFVFCLMAGNLVQMSGERPEDLLALLNSLARYGATVLVGLFVLFGFIYPIVYACFGYHPYRSNFFQRYFFFYKSMGPAQLLAFTTSSSAATLPVTMECVHNNLKISKETTSFVLPIGATINMDGTSLYQAVAVVFLAQLHWVDLTIAQQITVVLTATLASIGSAAVPSAGIIMLILVLQSVNLNPAWIAIILPIDRILDMCRTVVNVSGDGLVSSLVEKWESKVSKRDV